MATPQKITKAFILDHLDESELDLSLCYLTTVPVKELVSVQRFRKLDLSQNKLLSLPVSFVDLKFVTSIDLSKNQLTCLPDNFGELTQLQKLDLFGNELSTLPVSFSELRSLKWLDIRANRLEPQLVAIGGDCSSERECKDCANSIVKHMQELQVVMENKEKKKADRKKVKDKRKEKKRMLKEVETKKQKEDDKVRKRIAWEEKQQQVMNKDNHKIEKDNRDNKDADSVAYERRTKTLRILIVILIILIGSFVATVIIFWDQMNESLKVLGHLLKSS